MIFSKFRVDDIRIMLARCFMAQEFVRDKSGVKCIEIVGATFFADDDKIFGEVNKDYISREIEWYDSQSLNVNDIPGGAPDAWKRCASLEGLINSNYGYLVHSPQNYFQYQHVLEELRINPYSRRAVMIYNRPSMWEDYNKGGMSDFVCTLAHQYFIREGRLWVHVTMRSQDMYFGYRNDYAWASSVLIDLAQDLGLVPGGIVWTCGSLHVYEKDFYLIHHYAVTGETSIDKKSYALLYPDSEWK